MRFSLPKLFALVAITVSLVATQDAAAIIVDSLPTISGTATPGVWYNTSGAGGSASLVDLTGAGGDLENNQPLPTGAGRLVTGFDNTDRGRVEVFNDFGNANDVLTNGSLSYSYYKAAVPGGNTAAAPALQLSILGPNHGSGNDNFGTLVYEPTWNQGVSGSALVPTGQWLDANITASTGSGAAPGGWWWTGGFGEPNTAGGPPLNSLEEWASIFSSDPDFADARVVSLGVNVGTFNQGVDSYFDDVQFAVPGGANLAYDFSAVPEPSTVGVFGLIAGFLACRVGRRG